MTENEFKYWAFLSFSPQDNCEHRANTPDVSSLCWGDWLRDALKNFPIPADFAGQINAHGESVPHRIDSICQCGNEISGDANLSADVRDALKQSRCLIVICSPRSAKSRAVDEAVRYFKQLGRGNRILSIVIAGEPHARNASQPGLFFDDECFSPAMRHPVLPDGTVDTNRIERGYIFADARHGDDKREALVKDFPAAEAVLERAKIQLIAGLIGVGFNGLWQREQKRRFAGFAEAQGQIQEAWNQARKAQREAAETQKRVQALQEEARAAERKVSEAQQQLEEARNQIRDAQRKVLEIQNAPQDVKEQVQEAQNKAFEYQQQVQELKSRVREAEQKALEAQNESRDAQDRVETARNEAREAQNQLQKIQDETRDVQGRIAEANSETLNARNQLRELQNRSQAARRLTKVYAVMTLLAILAAGIAVNTAVRQRKLANETRASLTAAEAGEFHLPAGSVQPEQLRLTLRKIGGPEQGTNRFRSLDEIAARISKEQMPEILNLAADILADPQRSYFQDRLLDHWLKADSSAAFGWACRVTNLDSREIVLEKIIPALPVDDFTNTLAQLNSLTPVPDEPAYTLLFQHWAETNAAQAIEQRQQVPDHDAENRMLSVITTVWMDRQPAAAIAWLNAQPGSEFLPAGAWRDNLIAGLFADWATKDLAAATTNCQQLPEGPTRETAWQSVLSERIVQAPASAAESVTNLPAGDFRRQAMEELCHNWADADAPAALAWAQSLDVEAERISAVSSIVSSWAQADFTATTNWIAGLPDGTNKESAQLALAEPWAENDPKSLATNALALPSGELQARWLSAASRQLALGDFAGVIEMLQPLSDAALRQRLLEQAARNVGPLHVELAAKVIAEMPEGTDRNAAIRGLFSRWTDIDSAAAAEWIDSLSLPPEFKQTLK